MPFEIALPPIPQQIYREVSVWLGQMSVKVSAREGQRWWLRALLVFLVSLPVGIALAMLVRRTGLLVTLMAVTETPPKYWELEGLALILLAAIIFLLGWIAAILAFRANSIRAVNWFGRNLKNMQAPMHVVADKGHWTAHCPTGDYAHPWSAVSHVVERPDGMLLLVDRILIYFVPKGTEHYAELRDFVLAQTPNAERSLSLS